jgi:hypothetical protein
LIYLKAPRARDAATSQIAACAFYFGAMQQKPCIDAPELNRD